MSGVPFYKALEWNDPGANILGDPTLQMRYDVSVPSKDTIKVYPNTLTFSRENPTGEFTIENISDSSVLIDVSLEYLRQRNVSLLNDFKQKQFTMSANNYGYYTRFKERLNDDWKKGGYTIEAYKKVVVEMSRKNFFTDNSIPAGTYKEKYIVISKDSKNPMASVGITIVK